MIERTVACARVVCTDRHGGVSVSPFGSANLADHVGDEPTAVAENRRRVAESLGASVPGPAHWVWLRQVHGNSVLVADEPSTIPPPAADAAVTSRVGLPLVVLVADCAPIALVGGRAVGVVHAGWSGLELGVVERTVDTLRDVDRRAGADRDAPVRAVVGPCIHPGRYEFGDDLLARMVDRFGDAVAATTDWGTSALDVPTAVTIALRRVGVTEIDDVDVCTAESLDHFSYRRDGETGRQAVVVVRAA